MYYPKAKITENLLSSVGQFILKDTARPYQGPYYSTFDGKYFTGSVPSADSKQLISIKGISSNKTNDPTSNHPVPTENDYKAGQITRYVSKRVNSGADTIMEITKETSEALKNNPLYVTSSFPWKITGKLRDDKSNPNHPIYGVLDTNNRTLQSQEKQIPGISKVFINLIEFYK